MMKAEIASYLAVKAVLKIKLENLDRVFWPEFTSLIECRDFEGAKKLMDGLPECSLKMRAAGVLCYEEDNFIKTTGE